MGRRERGGAERGAGRGSAGVPPLEWAVAALGALLLAGALAFMIRQAFVSDAGPGAVVIEVTQVRRVGTSWLVEFEARNAGDSTYAELEVEGTLRGPGGREERARATLDYLPGGSVREGGLFFDADPRGGELELAAKGYRKP